MRIDSKNFTPERRSPILISSGFRLGLFSPLASGVLPEKISQKREACPVRYLFFAAFGRVIPIFGCGSAALGEEAKL
jgi:hypothetical protein